MNYIASIPQWNRKFAQEITTDLGGSALTAGLGGRTLRLDGSQLT